MSSARAHFRILSIVFDESRNEGIWLMRIRRQQIFKCHGRQIVGSCVINRTNFILFVKHDIRVRSWNRSSQCNKSVSVNGWSRINEIKDRPWSLNKLQFACLHLVTLSFSLILKMVKVKHFIVDLYAPSNHVYFTNPKGPVTPLR